MRLKLVSLLALSVLFSNQAEARDQIRVVGSSTVYPLTSSVAETFGKRTGNRTPIVESTGTGAGIKLFCAGVGLETPDIVNASRGIKDSELDDCKKNGVTAVMETRVGFDGIVLAHHKSDKAYDLTRKEVFLALAKEVPVGGKLTANPYKKWKQINPSLPDQEISFYGPPPTSGTRDAFVELVMDAGCKLVPEIAALPESKQRLACGTIREDGVYIESGENDNVIVQRLQVNHHALGIFGYGYFDQNRDTLQSVKIEKVDAEFSNILSGAYPVSRSMYLYTKKQHFGQVAGLKEFLKAYTSEDAVGEEGYLIEKGLIPLIPELRAAQRAIVDAEESVQERGQTRENSGGSPKKN
ncbi:MAG: PstS family phosphate ABC transporter substrate-binding protein [Holosporales bacterium]|jgi:phosphate transport system substrate-binding protein